MKTNDTLLVTAIERFAMRDGPGVRTVVFLKGCPLRCEWCHNPETRSGRREIMLAVSRCVLCRACESACPNGAQLFDPVRAIDRAKCAACGACAQACAPKALSLSGHEMSVDEILDEVEKDRAFYGTDGGLTVSGGEPAYRPEALLSLLAGANRRGIDAVIETSGAFSPELTGRLAERVSLFLYDIKDTDADRLRRYTGADRDLIYGNLLRLDQLGKPSVLRCVMIPGVNMTPEHARALKELFGRLSHARYIELLPYHSYGIGKAEQLGVTQPRFSEPSEEELLRFAEALGPVPTKIFGTLR